MPSRSQNAPISATAASAARATASAGRSPQRFRMLASENHIVFAKPPFRPLGPRPQPSASSRTTRAWGSSALICQAAHIPVYPPPITTTSALRSPTSGGAGATGPASASQ